jgi:hypothetical protein
MKPGIRAYVLLVIGGAAGALYVPFGFLVLGLWWAWPRPSSTEPY